MGKGLENLEIIKSIQTNNYDRRINDYTSVNEEYNYEIETIKKELKLLEIIKNKKVNIAHFYHVVFVLKKDYESCKLNNNNIMYNICDTEKEFLTPEEYNLLKEVLE